MESGFLKPMVTIEIRDSKRDGTQQACKNESSSAESDRRVTHAFKSVSQLFILKTLQFVTFLKNDYSGYLQSVPASGTNAHDSSPPQNPHAIRAVAVPEAEYGRNRAMP
jgi:hypothetical protein